MKRLIIIPIILIALGASAWVEYQRHEQRSVLSGFFENQPTQVASRIQGRVARILAKEGDTVKAGQLLIELEADPSAADAAASEAAAEQARQKLLETRRGPRIEDIEHQRAVVAELGADLRRLQNGSRPEEIAQARAAERNARERYAQAQRGLTAEERAQLKARLDVARTEESFAARDAARYTRLFHQGFVTRQEYERKLTDQRHAAAERRDAEQAWRRADEGTPAEELGQARQAWLGARASLDLVLAGPRREDIDAARARLEQAQAQLAALEHGSRPEEIAQAKAAAAAAQASAESSRLRVRERRVEAPMAGVIERIPVSVGDLVSPGTPLLRMSDPRDIWVRVYVPEDHLAQVSVGSRGTLAIDGIPQPLAARVESINTQGEFTPANLQIPEERGKQVFGVRVRLDPPDPRVKAGMYATVKKLGQWTP
jgi:HlyD family secretion protein